MSTTVRGSGRNAAAIGATLLLAAEALASRGGAACSYASLKDRARALATRDPLDSIATVVLGGSYLFYLAENGKNPKVVTFLDALTFITTCLSVGYDDVFAKTEAGKAVASFVMTFGPALSARALDPPSPTPSKA